MNIKEVDTDENFLNGDDIPETNIEDNWANSITVTDKLIILVWTTTSPKILSVYRKSDMKLMFKK